MMLVQGGSGGGRAGVKVSDGSRWNVKHLTLKSSR